MKQFCLGIIVAVGLTLPAFGQGVDPYIGTWKLNMEKLTWIGTPAPQSATVTFTRDGQNLAATLDVVVGPQGETVTIKYTMIFDGQPHPSAGSPDYDSTACVRFGNTINMVYFKNGKAVVAGQARIDSDKQHTYTSEGVAANGQPFRRVTVWDRQ
jgi:hypothetical protein